jgi:FlaG/FlaF family flagellin (archaellin)
MWIADLESVWMSNGAVGEVIATATAVAIASILVKLVGSSLTRPRKSAGACKGARCSSILLDDGSICIDHIRAKKFQSTTSSNISIFS